MTRIDIISGFLGAGKTTLIQKLLKEALADTKVVLIENEFGEVGIDGGFLKDAGIEIKEMNSGCICCSLVGDFGKSLQEVIETYEPERILIEPSGVGKLSDVIKAVEDLKLDRPVQLNSAVSVVDASKCKMYMKNFGEFFLNQVEYAGTIILSRTGNISDEKLAKTVEMIREHNGEATVITTPWEKLEGRDILETIEGAKDLAKELLEEIKSEEHHHGEHCTCGCHDHDHHHADEVFTSWGMETPSCYSREEMETILEKLEEENTYGMVLRAKGMVPYREDSWIYFDYVPGECNIREGRPEVTGKFCVIGSALQEENLKMLFGK